MSVCQLDRNICVAFSVYAAECARHGVHACVSVCVSVCVSACVSACASVDLRAEGWGFLGVFSLTQLRTSLLSSVRVFTLICLHTVSHPGSESESTLAVIPVQSHSLL